MNQVEFLTLKEAASLVRRSPRWIRGKIHEGLPCYGYRPLTFDRDELVEWFRKTQKRPNPSSLTDVRTYLRRRHRASA